MNRTQNQLPLLAQTLRTFAHESADGIAADMAKRFASEVEKGQLMSQGATLPMRVAPDSVAAFIAVCMEDDSRKAIITMAKCLPGMTLRELACYLEGLAHFEEVSGGMVVRLNS